MQWKELRAKVLKRDNYRCQVCGGDRKVIAHHLTYDLFDYRKVPERFLLTLCRTCHDKTFNRAKYKRRTSSVGRRIQIYDEGEFIGYLKGTLAKMFIEGKSAAEIISEARRLSKG